MLRILPYLLTVALVVWALVDILQTPEEKLQGLPKAIWILLILFFPVVGALAYVFAGKKRSRPSAGAAPRGRGPVLAPDDDPAFLEKLRLHKWEQELKERERKLRDEGDAGSASA